MFSETWNRNSKYDSQKTLPIDDLSTLTHLRTQHPLNILIVTRNLLQDYTNSRLKAQETLQRENDITFSQAIEKYTDVAVKKRRRTDQNCRFLKVVDKSVQVSKNIEVQTCAQKKKQCN